METLPLYIPILFLTCVVFTLLWFYKAGRNSKALFLFLILWLILQSTLALNGFYSVTTGLPPRFVLLVGPAFIGVLLIFILPAGRNWILKLDIKTLTLLHVVRIPVELVLYFLFIQKTIPQLMTFEGWNYDILSGLTAGLVYYLAFNTRQMKRKGLILWNIICLLLVLIIMFSGILSAPTVFQRLAFDQPNVAVFYFPYVLLPGFIVPVVVLSHLVVLWRLIFKKEQLTLN